MSEICPTVTATSIEEYRQQMERVTQFAKRVHIDVADGEFTPRPLVQLDAIAWPANLFADLHVMYKRPFDHLELIKLLHPQLAIVHAEAEGDFMEFASVMHEEGIEVGVALLPETSAELIKGALEVIDHVMIFSGTLGQFGGTADLSLLEKARQLREWKPALEIGWDGGVSEHNAKEIAEAGVDVLNVGGHIHQAPNPMDAFNTLAALV